jgi:hypothetical protein
MCLSPSFAILAGVSAGLSSSGTWSSHLDNIVEWASYVFGLTIHHPIVEYVDIREIDT